MTHPAGKVSTGLREGASGEGTRVYVAGMWHRLTSTLVDAVILSPILFVLGWLAFRLTGLQTPLHSEFHLESLLEIFLEGGMLLYGILGMGFFILLLYGFFFMGTTGATPGARLLHLRVINLYGTRPEWWRALLRCLGFVVSLLLLGLGFIWDSGLIARSEDSMTG